MHGALESVDHNKKSETTRAPRKLLRASAHAPAHAHFYGVVSVNLGGAVVSAQGLHGQDISKSMELVGTSGKMMRLTGEEASLVLLVTGKKTSRSVDLGVCMGWKKKDPSLSPSGTPAFACLFTTETNAQCGMWQDHS